MITINLKKWKERALFPDICLLGSRPLLRRKAVPYHNLSIYLYFCRCIWYSLCFWIVEYLLLKKKKLCTRKSTAISCRRAHVSKLPCQHLVCHQTHLDAFSVARTQGTEILLQRMVSRKQSIRGLPMQAKTRLPNDPGAVLKHVRDIVRIVKATLCMISSKI